MIAPRPRTESTKPEAAQGVSPSRPASEQGGWKRAAAAVESAWDFCFGGLALWAGLSLLATAPILGFLSLGYLLEVSGRVARTGRLHAGFFGNAEAARWGSVALAVWLMLLVPRLIGGLAVDAQLISPGGEVTGGLRFALLLVCLWIAWHTAAAVWQGGRLRHFLWPRPFKFLREVTREGAFAAIHTKAREELRELRLGYYFWLGVKGFTAALALLIVPTTLLAAGARAPGVGLIGALMLAAVVIHLPLLQARLAASGRFADGFNLRAVWSGYVRAPLVHAAAVVATLLLALPLYVLKIELVPREAAWLPSLLFVASVWPARLLAGWAIARAEKTTTNVWRKSLWLASLLGVVAPVAVLYALVTFFTRYASWYGVASLYEQHAFLLPVPFTGY